ncbi:D-aminoacyl-tRNA deacylase [Thermoflavifilum thermophilum]|uniref:D-aminoacyl-tRNA deacylase n=1 Tax=Thermoflavifilum thermophilum TaxID=1393122 RepID=A0A1I7N8J8_9BACT|nr:D-aminoacyl-tRNA deacylase [Thermoflavifilum thermophilum]SFV30896.1 D-tyrosyl-tRNA(Tyr) deacylase [Thermoflavifilum thermophilum]
MRAVIQRVSQARVYVDHQLKDQIGQGLCVLLGIEKGDTEEDVQWLSHKIVHLRIMDDDQGIMNRSVKDTGGDILLISQFTLLASTRRGHRPSYDRAAPPAEAETMYEQMIAQLEKDLNKPIHTGTFRAYMQVELINDGPVTICIDSRLKE